MKNPDTLKIKSLDGDWCDKDIVMLHACFQLLMDCIKKEKLLDLIDWSISEEAIKAKQEIETLRDWWKERLKLEKKGKLDPIWSEQHYLKDNEMLIRLINVRKYLWT